MARATYQFQVKWDGTNWTTEPLKAAEIARGMNDDFSQMQAGTCNVYLRDTTGRFNPANGASPIAANLKPLRQARLQVTFPVGGTTYDLFTGYTRRIESDPGRDAREARIECVDAFVLLSRASPTIATVATTTGGAIGLILDSVGYPAGASRALDGGDPITFSADGTTSGLQLIAGVLTAERGLFFISAAGVATYLDRHAPYRSPYSSAQSTIADTMSAIGSVVDLDLIHNRATVTRLPDGAAQTYTDAASVALYNYADVPAIATPYLRDDNQAMSLASFLVDEAKDATPPIRFLGLNNGKTVSFTALLARDIGDFVAVTDSLGGTSGNYHVRRVEHKFNASEQYHTGGWGLLRRGPRTPFRLDISQLNSGHQLMY